MAQGPGDFASENGTSIGERGTSTAPFVIAQGKSSTSISPAGERAVRDKRLVPFRFAGGGITIRGAIDPHSDNLFDEPRPAGERPALRAVPANAELEQIVAAVTYCNRYITDQSRRVQNILIAPILSSSLVIIAGAPVVFMRAAEEDVGAGTARHEMGHAIFDFWRRSRTDVARAVCKLFLALSRGAIRKEERAACPGIHMVSVEEWGRGSKVVDHPQGNADEFLASALSAFLTSPSGLRAAMDRASKADPERVAKSAPDLLALLADVDAQAQRGASFSARVKQLISSSATKEVQDELDGILRVGIITPEPGGIVELLLAL